MRWLCKYSPFSNAVLRSPILPFQELENLKREELKILFSRKKIQEAIYLATPVLHTEMLKWLNGDIKEAKEAERVMISLLRYYLRMVGRASPFGLFAGCSMIQTPLSLRRGVGAEVAISSAIALSPQSTYRPHTRLDMDYLCALAQDLGNLPEVKEQLLYFLNSSLYPLGNQLRYVEYKFKDKRRTHHIVSVANSPYLQKILSKAKTGATLTALASEITEDGITLEMATGFVSELVNEQVLVSNLEPSITGKEFLEQIIETLESINATIPHLSILKEIRAEIQKINETGISLPFLEGVGEKLNQLQTRFDPGKLFQTDMVKPVLEASVSEQTLKDIQQGIEILNLFTPNHPETTLSKFQEAFYERYEDKEVSLLEVMDTESGIGYPLNASGDISPLIDNLPIGMRRGDASFSWNHIQSFLLKKYMEALKESRYEVSLSDKEIQTLKEKHKQEKPMPDTMAVMINILEGIDENNPKEIIHMMSAGGSSAANLLGRFCYADEGIHSLVKAITQKEQELNPDIVFAEIIHLPEARVGNILLRPQVRDYEIPYLAKASVDAEYTLNVADLFLSVKQNRLVLRSKRLNKEIIPRLSSAHNYSSQALPVYHFLCDLQNQNHQGGVGFNWGSLSEEFPFLPRVSYQNLVLSLAQWNLKKEDFAEILKAKEIESDALFKNWRTKFKIPRYVALADGDNELVVDLENPLCQKVFIETIKNREAIKLVEFVFNAENAVVKSPEGSFVNQFIVPFYKNEGTALALPLSKGELEGVSAHSNTPIRTFPPGSEWVYFKLYCGSKSADSVLTRCIAPLAKELITNQKADKWFFIRYADPKEHLRIRFHATSPEMAKEIMADFYKAIANFEEKNLIWKVQLDTYQRELERYEGENIENAESLFYFDSRTMADAIQILNEKTDEELRWIFAIRNMDVLLNDFGYLLTEKLDLFTTLKTSFSNEFGGDKNLKLSLDKKFRDNRPAINTILNYNKDIISPHYPLFLLLKNRSRANQPIVEHLKSNISPAAINGLMQSFIHMTCNRIFRTKQRQHELVVYDFLFRYYGSELAKLKNVKSV